MVENVIVIKIIFAEIFVPQYFTIRISPELSGPANTCDCIYWTLDLISEK